MAAGVAASDDKLVAPVVEWGLGPVTLNAWQSPASDVALDLGYAAGVSVVAPVSDTLVSVDFVDVDAQAAFETLARMIGMAGMLGCLRCRQSPIIPVM